MSWFGVVSKKLLPCLRSSRFSLMLFSRSFDLFYFILFYINSMICFELICMKAVRVVSILIFWNVCAWLFQHHSLGKKNLSFINCFDLTPLSKISWQYLCDLFLALFCSRDLFIYSSPIPHYLDCYSYYISLEVRTCQISAMILLFISFLLLSSLHPCSIPQKV